MTTTPEATPPTPPPASAPAEPAQVPAEDWKAKYEDTLAQSRKHEDRAKANAAAAKELETLRASTMSETEKAVLAARAEGLSEGSRKAGEKVARAEIRAAAAGRNVDVDALLEGVDPTRFLDADGEPDTTAITAWIDRIAPAGDNGQQQRRDLGQGARGGPQNNAALNGDPLLGALKAKLGI